MSSDREIIYRLNTISFACPRCQTSLILLRRSPHVKISGIFCQRCDEQYWTRWDGTLHRGVIVAPTPPESFGDAMKRLHALTGHTQEEWDALTAGILALGEDSDE